MYRYISIYLSIYLYIHIYIDRSISISLSIYISPYTYLDLYLPSGPPAPVDRSLPCVPSRASVSSTYISIDR